jgi:glycosyltransferase involved in cell wall biosynthesis
LPTTSRPAEQEAKDWSAGPGFRLVSVIVPTYNRARLVPHLLNALARQIYPSSKLEVIVVDNSSTDGTREVVREWAGHLQFPLRVIKKENEGPTASRNVGASLARGELLAFTDSDCVPDACWIRNAVTYLNFHAEVAVVCGPMRASGNDGGLFGSQHEQTTRDTGLYPSGNLFIRREWFEKVGGFDERFGIYPWGALVRGEDTDLVWRARRQGARAAFVEDVLVEHLPGPPPKLSSFLLQPVVLQIFPRLVRTIPELRDTFLWRRYFVSRDHALFYLGAASVFATARTRRLAYLLGAAPWSFEMRGLIRAEYRRAGPPGVLASLALLIQHFIGCAVVLVISSIRHRRLVL